ncbi:hypothetical protein PYW07_011157 [Mythimna separata]|uniref:Uncharacterized protein n=1 Tax=Mythimna separata TaxID=271217 RepID=A0AAD8DKZ8_MYTSE|nr:hypothetical protein PYW07_011157 [Mythimna separata]
MFVKCILFLFVLSFIEAASPCTIPRIKNGRARPRQRGTFLRFSCSARYTLVGNKYATCRFGQWDVPIPVCVKTGCQELEEVKNAVNMTSHNNAWVVFFCLPGHQLVGSPVIYCDGSQWNSTAPGCYDSSAKTTETECDFEQPNICGWKPDEYHDFDWRRLNKKTPSSFLQTGPQYDHTYGKNGSGYYMYIESTGRIANETARLMSPVYEQDLAKDGCFVFWYHMFGRSMGGLMVYQKPDKLSMYQLQVLLLQKKAQNYTLFEQWGDQGNEWYSAVAMLSDVGDNFQIVIEGIRGESFMSDIAIDDVSIQHGENCTKAMVQATTPPTVLQESCVGRCDLYNVATGYRGCSCSIVCVVTQNCCPDFLDVCDLDIRSTSEDYSSWNSSAAQPQTQKLVATTTETEPPAPTSTSTVTITTTTKKPAPPVPRPTTTTTSRPTTTTTTTKKPTTTTTRRPVTTKRTSTTTTTTAPKPTTPKKTTPSTSTTESKPVFTRKTTTLTIEVSPISSSTIFFVRTTIPDAGVKTTEEPEKKGEHDKVVAKKTGGTSGATIAITVLLVAVGLVAALWAVYFMTRSTRGVAALARIRGRTTSDPEVHYLKSDVDDE